MPVDVFISHSSKDHDLALALIELLRVGACVPDSNIRCTSVDGYRLKVGANADEQLREEVKAARFFIGLITPSSIQSAYVLFELGARWGAGLHLAPVMGAGADPELLRGPLAGINALNCSSENQVYQLVEEVAATLGYGQASPKTYERYVKRVVRESTESDDMVNPTQARQL